MLRTDIINLLIKKINAKKYLEIGVSNGINLSQIDCEYKIGVDPDFNSPANIHLTSDDFFDKNKETFDIVFIDGLHHYDQVYKDIWNSLDVLNDGGYIVCHDMNPWQEDVQITPYNPEIHTLWTGDCWKAFVRLRRERSDLEMYVVDTDCGCGIIKKGTQKCLEGNEDLNWNNLEKNRQKWLNLISKESFIERIQYKVSSSDNFDELLKKYIFSPEDPENNYNLGVYYEGIGQTASAVSYYLRAAERYDGDLFKYESLIRSAICFEKQGTRNFTVKSLLLHALAVCPKRPEAYYLMSRHHEKSQSDGHWNECYTIASIGLGVCDLNPEPLKTDLGYPGEYALIFQRALSAWWCGLCDESKNTFLDLLENYDMNDDFKNSAIGSLKLMNYEYSSNTTDTINLTPFSKYNKGKFDRLKYKFKGSVNIKENYSEAYQDIFVLTMLNGKRDGTYLELGAGSPFYGSNTALLERDFNWRGVSLDLDEGYVDSHLKERKNPCLLKDGTSANYEALLSSLDFPNEIDYLQLDCDPPSVTYQILLTIPFEKYKFSTITYEHDYYCDETKSYQDKSRKYLESLGYVRVFNNISPDDNRPYEDWWVHPDLIDSKIISTLMIIDDTTKKGENIFLL
jgi:SAM-dependent methyltransferase